MIFTQAFGLAGRLFFALKSMKKRACGVTKNGSCRRKPVIILLY